MSAIASDLLDLVLSRSDGSHTRSSSRRTEYFGVKAAAMVAWLMMVVGAALIRGGRIEPLATDVPGWVALSPWLVALRLGYYNGALALAAYGGAEVGLRVSPLASIAFLVAALSVGLFPRLAEEFYGVVAE